MCNLPRRIIDFRARTDSHDLDTWRIALLSGSHNRRFRILGSDMAIEQLLAQQSVSYIADISNHHGGVILVDTRRGHRPGTVDRSDPCDDGFLHRPAKSNGRRKTV